jgi:hypothetical protein
MPSPSDGVLLWGLSWANLIAFGGVVGNFIFTSRKDKAARANAAALDVFNHKVRTPIETLLADLTSLMDDADDIVRAAKPLAEQLSSVRNLSMSFHRARRKLGRYLTDCDASEIVSGNQWSALEAADFDTASAALRDAENSPTALAVRSNLLTFARPVDSVRLRIQKKLDEYAKSLA